VKVRHCFWLKHQAGRFSHGGPPAGPAEPRGVDVIGAFIERADAHAGAPGQQNGGERNQRLSGIAGQPGDDDARAIAARPVVEAGYRTAQIAVDAASGIDQDPDSLPAIVPAAVGLAVARDHGLGQVARLQIALAGALRNHGKHFVRQRFNGHGRDGHLRESSF
jgi:hypothetical protein